MQAKSIPDRGNSRCKGQAPIPNLARLRSSQEAGVAGTEQAKGDRGGWEEALETCREIK